MNRLNPFDQADTISSIFFPPDENFYADIKGEGFKKFLLTNAMTDIDQQEIAKFYDVYDEWTQSTRGSDMINNYYELLLLVKTKSKKDNIWISFVEGLHRHAAIITCLLCTKFDHKNNIIKSGSLQLEDFRKADIPHYKDPGYNPQQGLQMIFNGENAAPMLTSQFTFQAFIPKTLDGEIQPIMKNMKIHSLWVLINKRPQLRHAPIKFG
jgi:hypothetical protein